MKACSPRRLLSHRRAQSQRQRRLRTSHVVIFVCSLLLVATICALAASVYDQAPALSRGIQELPAGFDECVKRAERALQAEGYGITFSGGGKGDKVLMGYKDIHSASIMCNMAPEGKTWVNIVVASSANNGDVPGAERVKLQGRMEQPSNAGTGGSKLNSLTVNPSAVAPGGKLTVYFTAQTGLPTNAWIGIVPSSVPHGDEAVNDGYDLTYQYLEGKTEGTMTFTAPTEPGQYDVRLFDTDNRGKELAWAGFTVK